MKTADRIAVAIVRCQLWRALFWLTRPIEHIRDLQYCDAIREAFGDDVPWGPITWRHVFLGHNPRATSIQDWNEDGPRG